MSSYVCSDFHGHLWCYEKIKDMLGPRDHVYFLGDAIDRGVDGLKIAQRILENKQFTYLLGNHEQMMLNYYNVPNSDNYWNWIYNGGFPTLDRLSEWRKIAPKEVRTFLEMINSLPLYMKLTISNNFFYLSHSGVYGPNAQFDHFTREDYLWDRASYKEPWYGKINEFVIHGHTPIQYMKDNVKDYNIDNQIMFYCNGHKICVDGGVVLDNKIGLLRLDDFETFILEE